VLPVLLCYGEAVLTLALDCFGTFVPRKDGIVEIGLLHDVRNDGNIFLLTPYFML